MNSQDHYGQHEDEPQVIPVSVFLRIAEDLDRHPDLIEMFGTSVTHQLLLTACGNDLRIETGGFVNLTNNQISRFLQILNDTIQKNTH